MAFHYPAVPPIAIRKPGERWEVYQHANGYAIDVQSGTLTVVHVNYAMGATQTLASFPRGAWLSLTSGSGAAVPHRDIQTHSQP